MNIQIRPISLGKGQEEQAKTTIYESCEQNHFVLLQNCHLALSWLPELENIIEMLGSEAYTKKLSHNFRLFLTAFSTSSFPISILQDGIKLTKDPPKGIKANMMQIYVNQNSTKNEKKFYDDIVEFRTEDWRPLFMSLSYFHSVIRERRRFGPVGWNIPYDFNESDFKISVKQLKHILNNSATEIPFTALIYLTSECYYGGKVTDSLDRRLLSTLLADFYNYDAIKEDYRFSEKEYYFIPKDPLDLTQSIDFFNGLPDLNEPEIYGLNSNASISSAIGDTRDMIDYILTINPSSSKSSQGVDINKQLKLSWVNIMNKLPPNFDIHGVREKHPIHYDHCMNTVLIQEILRYNNLLTGIKNSLTDLKKACEGTIVMTSQLEDMADKMMKNQIPIQWAKHSYPSLKPMLSYIDDLLKRIQMFKQWNEVQKPLIYWVPGFFFTQSFFTGVLQDYARKKKISIDCLEFKHFVMPDNFDETQVEGEGWYVRGLYLEAARWNQDSNSLDESIPKEIFFNMPTIYFKPVQIIKEEQNSDPNAPIIIKETVVETVDKLYECPLYKTTERRGTLSTTGHSTNYILSIKIRTEKPEAHWVKRGVALLTQLND